jgi:hypothetical protein
MRRCDAVRDRADGIYPENDAACKYANTKSTCNANGKVMFIQRHSTYLILKYWLPVAVCAGCIFYLSVSCNISVVGMAFYVSESDKLDHMMAYGALSGCCYRAFQSVPRPWMAKYCGSLAVLAATVFGLFCEWCQLFVPGRMADGMDVMANSVGAIFGFAALSMRVYFRTDVGNSRTRHLMQTGE